MTRRSSSAVIAVLLSAPFLSAQDDVPAGGEWPAFRGPGARGVGEGSTAVRWSVERAENVLWRTRVPGLGHSSPIVWGERLYVSTAVRAAGDEELRVGLYGDIKPVDDDSAHAFRLLALDARGGGVVWERTAVEAVPKVRRHPKSSHASSTPATDGKRVVAFFGSEGLYCYGVDGELVWKRDLGLLDSGFYRVPEAQWGFGSSPVIHDGKVIVQCDVQGQSFVAALDLESGKDVWRTPRDEVPTWSTPAIVPVGDAYQVVVNGYRHIGGYDAATGEEVWRLRGGGDIPVPTPVFGGGLVFITSAHGPHAPIYAVRAGARGDVTPADAKAGEAGRVDAAGEHLAWLYLRGGNYMQTPLLHDGLLYLCRDNGVLACYEAASGELVYRERLGSGTSGFTASMVAASGKLYATSEDGDVYVVRLGRSPERLAMNDLGETCMATPAIARGVIYFRTRSHVVAVAPSGGKAVSPPPSEGSAPGAPQRSGGR